MHAEAERGGDVDLIRVADHRVTEPVGGHAALDLNVRLVLPRVVEPPGLQHPLVDFADHVVEHRRADQSFHEVVPDEVLVGPSDEPLRSTELDRGCRCCVVADDLVAYGGVDQQERELQLRHDDVLVVAGFAN